MIAKSNSTVTGIGFQKSVITNLPEVATPTHENCLLGVQAPSVLSSHRVRVSSVNSVVG